MNVSSPDTELTCSVLLWCPGTLILQGLSIPENAFCCPLNCTRRYVSPLETWSDSSLSLPGPEQAGAVIASDSHRSWWVPMKTAAFKHEETHNPAFSCAARWREGIGLGRQPNSWRYSLPRGAGAAGEFCCWAVGLSDTVMETHFSDG